MEDEEMAVGNRDFLVTETEVDLKLSADQVVNHLLKRRVTGQLVFNISQGAIQKVALVERTKVKDELRVDVREILGV